MVFCGIETQLLGSRILVVFLCVHLLCFLGTRVCCESCSIWFLMDPAVGLWLRWAAGPIAQLIYWGMDVETRTNVLTHFSFFFLHFQDLKRTSLPTASRFALPQASSLLSASWTIPAAPTPACPSLALSPPFGHQSKLEKGKRFSTAMVSHPSSLLPTLVQQKRTGWIRMSKQLGRCLHPSSVCFLEEAVHT